MKIKNYLKENLFIVFTLFFSTILLAQPAPPEGKKWKKIEEMSDEFNDGFDTTKWAKNDPQWKGRTPAIFLEESVTVNDGKLKIEAAKLSRKKEGYTHRGGLVRSLTKKTYGYYETRMKANKTFMSSTFWLINKRNEFSGCDFRVTELDVTENIGINTGGKDWINRNIVTLNSNTHSRGAKCDTTPVGIVGNKADIGEPAYAGYHTYGVWWKNEKELLFYLDGEYKYTVEPKSKFNLGMYLRMVVETYNWNPPIKRKDGMKSPQEERTTYYDWVRSYELVDL